MDEQGATNKTTKKNFVTQSGSFRHSRMTTYSKIVRWIWGFYLLGLVAVSILFISLSYQLPSFKQLEDPQSRVASIVYAANIDSTTEYNEILGKYYVENRTIVPYDSLSPHLINALVSTEDTRFYNHSGIDSYALGRVLVKTVLLQQRGAGGGSTISQQLAKLLVGRPDTKGRNALARTWLIGMTKFKEWLTAVKLERSYTKREIIAMYLNEFDFLFNAHGIRSAAEIYFQKTTKNLTINEAAMLVRMLKNPSLYNPILREKEAMKGREQVLKNMQRHKHITREQYDQLRVKPIDAKLAMVNHNDGIATYFREYLRGHLKKLLKQERMLKPNGKPYDLYRDGLKIYTTIDARYQRHAEKAVWDHLSKHQKKLFQHWPNWNNKDSQKQNKNPWTYKSHKTSERELALRRWAFERVVWNTDHYKRMREKMLPTAIALKLRDSDIYRMREVERANKRSEKYRRKKQGTEGDNLLNYWVRMKYIDQAKARNFQQIMKSSDWDKIKKEYATIFAYLEKPVAMKIFAYNVEGEIDTVMSPLDSIRYHRMHLQTGSVAMDTRTGRIKSWVGGINHKYFKYDHANKSTARQVGSTIKPFLYALTIDQRGYSPCYEIWDDEITIEKGYGQFNLHKDWSPKNAGGGYSGQKVTLIQALKKSLNSVSVRLMKDLNSPEPLRVMLNNMGIDTAKVPNSPTICLGTADLSVYEMVGGYGIFANLGIYNEPVFIDRIEDSNGNILYTSAEDQDRRPILSKEGAYTMCSMLQKVQSGASGFRGIKSKFAGKTGTTNFQADGWFMGMIPGLVIGTWVGCDDRFIRFRTLTNGQGAHMARPIFQNYLRNLESDSDLGIDPKSKFPRLQDTDSEATQRSIEMNCGKYDDGLADELLDYTQGNDFDDFD